MDLRCHLISSQKIEVTSLIRALQDKGVAVSRSDELSAGISIIHAIPERIFYSDFVVAVLSKPEFDANVYFEIGLAQGLGKRTLLFATEENQSVPFDHEHHYIVRSSLSNETAVEFAIEQIISAPPKSAQRARGLPLDSRGKPLETESKYFLNRLNQIPTEDRGLLLEAFVADLLLACGVEVLSESSRKEKTADFAVWSDELEQTVGNPLVIEVKRALRSKSVIGEAGQQLSKYVANGRGNWGLLLYKDGRKPSSVARDILPPNIICLRLDELLEQLRNSSFSKVIKHHRNNLVHGINF